MPDFEMLERSQGRGLGLAWKLHAPPGVARVAVLLTHGYGEHSERYAEVVQQWTQRGLLVATYDLRGHGRSEGPRGHIEEFRDYVRDAQDLLQELERRPEWKRLGRPILFGHSLGGLIAVHVALAAQRRYRAVALSSPFLGLALAVPRVKKWLGRAASRWLPRLSQPAGLQGSDMTHDAEIAARYDADPLSLKHVTARWFTEVEQAQGDALALAPAFSLPLLVQAAGNDRVVSVEATRRFVEAARSTDKRLRVLDGQFHEILNELGRTRTIGDFAEQMLAWADGAG
jgi:alpha-beta hydrolase superfamily lysophospholipase